MSRRPALFLQPSSMPGGKTSNSAQESTAADDAFRLAAESLLKLGEHWSVVPRQTKEVAKFLHDFYASWVSLISVLLVLPDIFQDHAVRMGQLARADGLDKAAQALRVNIEEAAESFAEIDWLVTFPTLVKDNRRKCVIMYTAALCRARAKVIDDCMSAWHFGEDVRDPYELATREIQDLHNRHIIGDYDRMWITLRLRRDREEGLKERIDANATEWAQE